MTWHGTAGATRRALGAALLTGALAAGAAGCGSSDDDAATTAAAAAGAATATATTPAAPTQTTATATDVTPKPGEALPTGTEPLPTTAAATPPPASTTPTTPRTTTTPAAPTPATPTRSTGSAADQAAVRRTVDRYMQAFVAGDGATVCGLLDDRQRRLLGSRGAGTCEEATKTAQAAVAKDATIRKALESLRVGKVAVDGDRAVAAATVRTSGRDGSFPVALTRTAGGWRISSNALGGG